MPYPRAMQHHTEGHEIEAFRVRILHPPCIASNNLNHKERLAVLYSRQAISEVSDDLLKCSCDGNPNLQIELHCDNNASVAWCQDGDEISPTDHLRFIHQPLHFFGAAS